MAFNLAFKRAAAGGRMAEGNEPTSDEILLDVRDIAGGLKLLLRRGRPSP